VAQFFKVQLESVIPHSDYIIGNESEAQAWGAAAGVAEPTDHIAVARSIALLPKSNPSRPRVVIITRGSDPTIVVSSAQPDKPKMYPVDKLADSEIVDTNGAGDAFAGGFMGGLVLGKSLDDAVEIGHKMGAMNLKEVSTPLMINAFVLTNFSGRASIHISKGPNRLRFYLFNHIVVDTTLYSRV